MGIPFCLYIVVYTYNCSNHSPCIYAMNTYKWITCMCCYYYWQTPKSMISMIKQTCFPPTQELAFMHTSKVIYKLPYLYPTDACYPGQTHLPLATSTKGVIHKWDCFGIVIVKWPVGNQAHCMYANYSILPGHQIYPNAIGHGLAPLLCWDLKDGYFNRSWMRS